ncbi:LysM peptidoglycan-binding domain-containing protein [Spiribacter vilamensis]|uniref:Membrane-bound lytic murein transglycosylase D n=1 Tax=Spiribacter vilamensis TaxID=531306 RepID=A0A4Q8CYQ1_9GAMM|nr:LysM peptidoglycan-binding domain-containing protein [Spiribacter vilamensis]RZU98030.1 membrane-bound lytic murein transglycosylase D [Spiribacter vilamensis]TVO61065.1 LysM peptidoglycan-binding domain-containing protein [Spiribacter vilamensis]
MLTLRRALQTVLLVGGMVSASAAETPALLPVPEALEPAVEFWQRIYTEVSVDEGVIHETGPQMRIIARIDVPRPPHWQARREAIREALDRHRDALNALADQGMQPASARQSDLLARLPGGTGASAAREMAERLRFQGGLRQRFREGLVRSGRWRAHIRAELASRGVPAELAALPHVESSFNPQARSHAGAAGLWQFTAGTGRRFLQIDPVVDERLDPWKSSTAAAALLAHNYAELGRWPLAITAYNHGLNGMRRAVREVGSKRYMDIRQQYEGGRFGFASRNFYPAFIAAARIDADAERYFPGLQRDPPLKTVRVRLPHYTPVDTLLAGTPIERPVLQRLNPGLGPSVWDGRKFIPRKHELVLPAERGIDWATAIAGLPGDRLYRNQRPTREHAVTTGQTLSAIAQRYDIDLQALMVANGIADPRRLRAGQRLDLPMAGSMPAAVGGHHHEVRPGETLEAIAIRHDVDIDELVRLNELDDPDRIQAGHRLRVTRSASVAVVDMTDEP